MKYTASVTVVFLMLAFSALAQETNSYPKSRLELFEANTSTVLIKGTDDIGALAGKLGVVTVKCRETKDATTGLREFGVIVTVTQAEGIEDTTVVDFDELDGLLRALDYISKVEWSITSLGHFEASFTTKSGLKVATYSSRRTTTVEAQVMSNRLMRSRSFLTTTHLTQLRTLIEQAKTKLEIVRREK
jgi:hypothetical protein